MNSQAPLSGPDKDGNSRFFALFDRLGRGLIERPAWFAATVFLALIALPIAVWLDMRHLSTESLTRQASELNSTDIPQMGLNDAVG